MKLLLASRTLGDIERIRSALEQAGIACMIRNDMTSGLAGEVPFSECTPEIWILEDEQLQQAKRVLAALESEPVVPQPAWTCPKCGETIEGQFDSCWRCGSQRA